MTRAVRACIVFDRPPASEDTSHKKTPSETAKWTQLTCRQLATCWAAAMLLLWIVIGGWSA